MPAARVHAGNVTKKRGDPLQGPDCPLTVRPRLEGRPVLLAGEGERSLDGPLLNWIVADRIAAGGKNGLVLGFIREIWSLLGDVRASLEIAVAASEPRTRPRKALTEHHGCRSILRMPAFVSVANGSPG
jgi:hypothetical protein